MEQQKIIIKEYTTLPEEARHLRTVVFVEEQGFVEEFDTQDLNSYHLVLFLENKAVCCCRYFTGQEKKVYILGRLATLKEYRGKQLASQILKSAEDKVKVHGGKTLILHAQTQAQHFYEKNGYVAYGDVEPEEGVPHIWMKKEF